MPDGMRFPASTGGIRPRCFPELLSQIVAGSGAHHHVFPDTGGSRTMAKNAFPPRLSRFQEDGAKCSPKYWRTADYGYYRHDDANEDDHMQEPSK